MVCGPIGADKMQRWPSELRQQEGESPPVSKLDFGFIRVERWLQLKHQLRPNTRRPAWPSSAR